jgi:hypothetical protein
MEENRLAQTAGLPAIEMDLSLVYYATFRTRDTMEVGEVGLQSDPQFPELCRMYSGCVNNDFTSCIPIEHYQHLLSLPHRPVEISSCALD